MTVYYTNADWSFNSDLFAEHLQKMTDADITAVAQLMDISRQAIERWKSGNYKTEFNFPRMCNFLTVCNLLDLDPRDYFTI